MKVENPLSAKVSLSEEESLGTREEPSPPQLSQNNANVPPPDRKSAQRLLGNVTPDESLGKGLRPGTGGPPETVRVTGRFLLGAGERVWDTVNGAGQAAETLLDATWVNVPADTLVRWATGQKLADAYQAELKDTRRARVNLKQGAIGVAAGYGEHLLDIWNITPTGMLVNAVRNASKRHETNAYVEALQTAGDSLENIADRFTGIPTALESGDPKDWGKAAVDTGFTAWLVRGALKTSPQSLPARRKPTLDGINKTIDITDPKNIKIFDHTTVSKPTPGAMVKVKGAAEATSATQKLSTPPASVASTASHGVKASQSGSGNPGLRSVDPEKKVNVVVDGAREIVQNASSVPGSLGKKVAVAADRVGDTLMRQASHIRRPKNWVGREWEMPRNFSGVVETGNTSVVNFYHRQLWFYVDGKQVGSVGITRHPTTQMAVFKRGEEVANVHLHKPMRAWYMKGDDARSALASATEKIKSVDGQIAYSWPANLHRVRPECHVNGPLLGHNCFSASDWCESIFHKFEIPPE